MLGGGDVLPEHYLEAADEHIDVAVEAFTNSDDVVVLMRAAGLAQLATFEVLRAAYKKQYGE